MADFVPKARWRPQERLERWVWHMMEDTAVWNSFDNDVSTYTLYSGTTLQSIAVRKIETLETYI